MSESAQLLVSDPVPLQLVRFTIPGAPAAKGRPRTAIIAGHAVVYTPSKTRREEGAVRLIADAAMDGYTPMIGPIAVEIVSYLPIPASWSRVKQARAEHLEIAPTGRPDLDNIAKLALDSMLGIVFRDDAQIVSLRIRKDYSRQPRTEVLVAARNVESSR